MAYQSPYQLPMEGKQAGGDRQIINWDKVDDNKQHPQVWSDLAERKIAIFEVSFRSVCDAGRE
jgi:hypothetical protein